MRILAPFCKRPTSVLFSNGACAFFTLLTLGLLALAGPASELRGQDAVDTIRSIERGGRGVAEASAAAEQLMNNPISLDVLLNKAATANPIAKNWLLSIAQSIVDRQEADARRQFLENLLANQLADGELRYWALDRLSDRQPELREKLLEGRTDDPSLDIRYEAIELALKQLPSVDAAKDNESIKQQLVASYTQLLNLSRLAEQIFVINAKLKELDSEIDLRKHFGFVSNWQVVGPFDNRQQSGFEVVYPPEAEYTQSGKLDMAHRYPGKAGEVAWQAATTDKPDGLVNLNPLFSNEKAAVVYAYANVDSPVDAECQVRFGTANANRVWVNGEESTANNVYHTGSPIDQYVGAAKLRRGTNTVLMKICQNEQTEEWAQDFAFKLRFTDATGRAIPVKQ